jgi:hypothetical protein
MKINKKSLELVELGFSSKLVSKLTESQVNTLHSRLVNEEIKTQVTNITYDPSVTADQQKLAQKGVHVNPSTKKITMSTTGTGAITTETETTEQEQDEAKKESNPWAICTTQLGKEFGTTERSDWSESQLEKYERCVKDVKESLMEGKNPVTLFLENKIMELVEKHIPAKITKGDLIKHLVEQNPQISPKPGTKEPKPGTKNPPKPKPQHPGKNPNPGENPAPKAKKIDPEVAKDEILDLIKNILEK